MFLAEKFENSIPIEERKKLGQYYTPVEIVDYILNRVGLNGDSKVFDPSCGCGIFLLRAAEKLEEIKCKNPLGNIWGADINKDALSVTKKILSERFSTNNTFGKNLVHGNSITQNKSIDKNALNFLAEFPDVFEDGGFDVIVGNPPYITLKKNEFDAYADNCSEIINGPVNCATLMVWRGLNILKKSGTMGFLLPKTIIRVDSYRKLRIHLLKNYKIIEIFDLGSMFKDVRGEQFILVVKNEEPNKNKILIKNFVNKNANLYEQPAFHIPQKDFIESDIFPAYETMEHYNLIKKIQSNKKTLSSFAEIFRGIGIGANSPYVSSVLKKGYEKVLRGDSIGRLKLNYELYISPEVLDKLPKPKLTRLKKKKLVLQNIFSKESGILATLDTKATLTLDTVTNILPKSNFDLYCLLGLLNSKAVNYYLISGVFYKSLLTMHTDSTYLGRIPIPNIDENSSKKISSLVKELLKKYSKDNENKLNELVYQSYNLTDSDKAAIEQFLAWK